MLRKTVWMLPALALTACGGEETTAPDPTYTSISEKVFVPTCATGACHGGTNPQAGLDLTKAKGRESLLSKVQSDKWAGTTFANADRVKAGDPAASALIGTLEQPSTIPVELHMPSGQKLPDTWIAAIRTWVQNGAKND